MGPRFGLVAVIGNAMFYASVVVILNHEGSLLVVRRGANLSSYPGFWCFPGGRAEDGESPKQCAVREVLEEVSLDVDENNLTLLNTISNADKDIFVFASKVFSGTPKIDWESDAFMWIKPHEISSLRFIPVSNDLALAINAWIKLAAN